MNCSAARQQIFAERDGALGQAQRAALAEHVAGCAECRRVRHDLAAAVDVWRADVREARIPSPDVEWQKVRRRLHAGATHRRSMAAWVAVPVAAAAAVAIGLYVAPGGHHEPAGGTREVAAAVENRPAVIGVAPADSTVVYVDDKSGWTFVWEPTSANDRQI